MLNKAEARQVLLSTTDNQFCEVLKNVLKAYRPKESSQGWLTIRHAAALACISVRSLQRKLAKGGTDFSQLIDLVRCELAVELLGNTNASVAEIAIALGYSSPPNFSRAFKRWTGKSPIDFRKQPPYTNELK